MNAKLIHRNLRLARGFASFRILRSERFNQSRIIARYEALTRVAAQYKQLLGELE